MKAVEALTLISGRVSQEILLRNEYLAAEYEILRSRLGTRVALTQSERVRLAKLGKKLGNRALHGVSAIVKPETVLGWYRRLVAQKFDGSKNRKKRGRPRVDVAVERSCVSRHSGRSCTKHRHPEHDCPKGWSWSHTLIDGTDDAARIAIATPTYGFSHGQRNRRCFVRREPECRETQLSSVTGRSTSDTGRDEAIVCDERLGGILKFYRRAT